MNKSTTSCFPDINVWLAIVVERHVHSRAASAWWNLDQSDAIGFCRFTQLGLLRHLTNAATMKGAPLTNRRAWKTFETLQVDARVRFFPEWPALDGLLKSYTDTNQPATKIWGDAYLAAYAAVNSATLVTFDKGFARYPVKSLILESP
jgi:toxin-antitoxin system PIN domain toxin